MIDWLTVISLSLHLLATVVWIGGLLLMSVLVWPEARAQLARLGAAEDGRSLLDYLDRLRKRFIPLANLSLFVLVGTGLYQMDQDPNYEGLLQFTNAWSQAMLLKHLCIIGMVIAGGLMQWYVLPTLDRALLFAKQGKTLPGVPSVEALRRRERRLVTFNTVLGLLVLVFTAIATSL